ncbi:hypothetical protein E4K67_05005 [Desulfosporosinus fructosivorans]|uniref:DUF4083 domain-containing protein n=1 Tax=Desulfosporosinus fructosivorans TaxID=2018669 RepID=A0A4Z0RB48_9FIRM|nr:hypothetical protein E4K67_05005 [Desulfosporosinus fructosivorans]
MLFDYTVLATLFSLVLVLLIVYFIVSAIRFFKRKSTTDEKLLQKLDELIKLQSQQSDQKSKHEKPVS